MKLDYKVWVVVGTRPEVIKQVPVYRALAKKLGKKTVGLIGTGQHRELLQQALSHFGETLDFNLDLMKPGQALGLTAASVMQSMEETFAKSRPELIIVQGDTTTAAMTAVSAFHNGITVAHNEAGLRTYDLQNPWPEEANRRWIGVVADIHFPPTERAKQALLREGVAPEKIHVVGNPGIDSLFWTLSKPCPTDTAAKLKEWKDKGLQPVLVTAHRRENDASKMSAWFQSLGEFLEKRKDIVLVCPLHPNLRAADSATKYLGSHERAWLCKPLDYASVCHVLKECRFIVTDSGGLQEESATLQVPCVVCRKVTERMEAVDVGIAHLADPTDGENILKEMSWAYEYAPKAKAKGPIYPFGDGKSADRITSILFS